MYTCEINGIHLEIESKHGLFSPNHLDVGTMNMLMLCDLSPTDKVLDIGCGCGVVGIYALKNGVSSCTFSDCDEEAVEMSKQNAAANLTPQELSRASFVCSDAFDEIHDRDYSVILCNPPYHTDFSVAKRIIEGAFRHLSVGGRLHMVTKRLKWYQNKLTTVFGGVRIREADDYYVFISEKRSEFRPKKK